MYHLYHQHSNNNSNNNIDSDDSHSGRDINDDSTSERTAPCTQPNFYATATKGNNINHDMLM